MKCMNCSVVIALNSAGKRKVGEIITLFENLRFEFSGIVWTKSQPRIKVYPNDDTLHLRDQLWTDEFLIRYATKYSSDVLDRKVKHFLNNHVQIDFVSEKEWPWKFLEEELYSFLFSKKKYPIALLRKT